MQRQVGYIPKNVTIGAGDISGQGSNFLNSNTPLGAYYGAANWKPGAGLSDLSSIVTIGTVGIVGVIALFTVYKVSQIVKKKE